MALSPFQRYLANPHYVNDVRWHVRNATAKTVPPEVLRAHWAHDDVYEMLTDLACDFAIVPSPLGDFVADCCKRKRSYLPFIHPHSLFNEPALASWVFRELGNSPLDGEILQLLSYLASSEQSKNYRHHVQDYIVHAFASEAAYVCGSKTICNLCAHYLEPGTELCAHTLSCMLTDRGMPTRVHALSLLSTLTQATHARVINALVWCAVYGYGAAARFVQDLSAGEYAVPLARAVQQFPHHFYVDRLHLDTLRRMVPYLIHYRALSCLVRLYEADRHAAIAQGVLTALLANRVRPLLLCWPVPAEPRAMHDAVHYMYVKSIVPPNRYIVDDIMRSHLAALRTLVPTTAGLQRQMDLASNWYRRRVILLMLLQGTDTLMQRLRRHEFAWRLVFAFL